ncbi:LamG-like jellyroll fold domain-containing protein [Polaribacter cellanae]|uniref:T9SS type A sorting domain-containing protein n=1 Tax=Polaribacter cellanae TaxID=2818493 RepID=A0A975CSL7_9FLAO|nr:LamG-like jellyroll fold domain-containing protein [Polaribacter cellanae]QTE23217.1 T9SS type A sorting domain-containing protein [Polaribacter cellanae]
MQTLTGATTLTCPQDNTLTLQSSETNFNYFLRNNADNTIVDGPIAGTGGALQFSTGVITTATTYHVYAESNTDNALHFDGVDDYVETTDPIIPASGDFSVTFWVKRNTSSFTDNEHFFAQGTGAAATFLGISGSGEIRAGNDWQHTGVTFPADTNWHHLALVKTKQAGTSNFDVYLYLDGAFVASQTGMPYSNPAQVPFRIARQYEPHQEYVNGQIDQLTVWDKRLSETEVIQTQTQAYSGTEPHLISYFNFNEGSGTTLTNSVSGSTNHGTLKNMDAANWVAGKSVVGTMVSNTQTITFNDLAMVYVDASATGTNCGNSWANAFTNIQDAINRVAADGQVFIAEGTYKEGAEIRINKPLTLTGGYPSGGGTQDIANNPTILDGDDAHRVLHINAVTKLQGLTVQQGKVYTDDYNGSKGAGIYTITDLNLDDVIVQRNICSGKIKAKGAGIYTDDGNITIKNCIVSYNLAYSSSYSTEGGGVYTSLGNITVTNSSVSNNAAISNSDDWGVCDGGGIYSIRGDITLINSLVSYNFVSYQGFDTSNLLGGGIYGNQIILQNSILWDNSKINSDDIFPSELEYTTLTAHHSLIKGQNPTGTHNIDATISGFYPMFVYDFNDLYYSSNYKKGGNFRLQAGSPLINAGSNSYTSSTTDLDGNTRIKNTNVDIGPYEYQNPFTGWTGHIDSSWDNTNNWNGGLPTTLTETYIYNTANQPILDIDGQAKDLTLATNSSLVINTGKGLTIGNNLTNNGTVTIHSNATSSGSLQVKGNATGNITYNRYVTDNWHTVGAPVIGQNIQDVVENHQVIQNGDNTKYAIAPYNNNIPTKNWEYALVANIAATGNFVNGKGYSMKRATAGTYSFTGTIENNNKTVTLTDGSKNNWNLIANPYPSFLKFNNLADASANVLLQNAAQLNTNNLAIYIWDTTTSSYKPYNHASTNLQYIAPGQAFFVNAKDGGGTFTFNKNLQTHNTGNVFAKSSRNSNLIFEMSLKASFQSQSRNLTKSTEIKYLENTTKGLDVGYDAEVFTGENNSFSVYTHLLEDNNNKAFALQCLPPNNFKDQIIPIGVNAAANTTISFTVDAQNTPKGINIYLEDKQENTFTKLSNNGNYEITLSAAQSGVGRFYLHTTSKVLNSDEFSTAIEQTKIWLSENRILKIANLSSEKATIQLFDVLGKEVFTKFLTSVGNDNVEVQLPNKLKQAVYLVRLQTDRRVKIKKIIVK